MPVLVPVPEPEPVRASQADLDRNMEEAFLLSGGSQQAKYLFSIMHASLGQLGRVRPACTGSQPSRESNLATWQGLCYEDKARLSPVLTRLRDLKTNGDGPLSEDDRQKAILLWLSKASSSGNDSKTK